jgi:hypothetical protein
MEGGLPYDDAAVEVAKKFKFGKDTRQIKKIYGRWRRNLEVASDKRTDDMASDR